MIEACIFDLDGVLVDTAKYHYIAWKRLANELGFDFDEAFNEHLKGVSRMESLNLILEHGGVTLSQEEKQQWATKKNDWYRSFILEMTPDEILEGVLPFLDQLEDQKIKFALGSASKNAGTILERLELTQRFSAIIDGRHTTKGKPDPQVFLMGAEKMQVAPEACIVFEDAAKGVQAALNGSFWAVGVGSENQLGHAHLVIPNLVGQSFQSICKKLNS